jgi:NADPH-dependent 2,4-dienoyl-CoA reductase/sulfur reductase-like enzyme
MKLVIVGGVAGGASAAARARRLSEDAEIVVFERGPDVSFANCGLPYYVGETIRERQSLLVTTAERLRSRFQIDVRTRSMVIRIDRAAKTVHVREFDTGREYDEAYDVLLLAPGAAPLKPPVPGIESSRVFVLRNLGDVDRIKAHVDAAVGKPGGRVVVVGAGFIGLELAENLVRRKLDTTVVELQQQVLPPLDPEMTTPIVQTLRSRGVRVLLGDSAAGFVETEGGVTVQLASGGSIEADLVIVGVGVRPENALATEAGLEVGPRGGIKVSASMETSDRSIYAVGDAIEVVDVVTGAAMQVPLAGPANRQGRIAADTKSDREVAPAGVFVNSESSIGGCNEDRTVTSIESRSKIRCSLEVGQDTDQLGQISLSWSGVVSGRHDHR